MKIWILAQIIFGGLAGLFFTHSASYHANYFVNSSSFNPYEKSMRKCVNNLTWLILEPKLLRPYFGGSKVKGTKSSFVWTNSMCVTSVCQHPRLKFLFMVVSCSCPENKATSISVHLSQWVQRAGWGAHQRHGRLQVYSICCLIL